MTMKYMNKKLYRLFALFLALAATAASCIKEDLEGGGQNEEITIRLSAGTRAEGEDPLIHAKDEKFGSLAVYVFEADGRFVSLYKEEDFALNNIHEASFNCYSNARILLGVANYAAYTDLAGKLTTGLTLPQVKDLVANADGATVLGDGNILMVGQVDVPAFTQETENIPVSLTLKRLAARIDIHAFKETGWMADVQLTSVEFAGGVANTTLNVSESEIDLPGTLKIATPKSEAASKHLAELPAEWKAVEHRNMCFYSYRTRQAIASDDVPRLKFTVRINNNITKEYEAVIANPADAFAVLDAGKVYQVQAVLSKSGLTVSTAVADWEQEDSELDFTDNLSYTSNGWQPGTYADKTGNVVRLTPETDGIISFTLQSPNTAKWNAVLTNPEYFRLKVDEGEYQEDETTAQPLTQRLEIELLKPEYTGYAETELAVYATIGGTRYELDLTHDGTGQKPSENVERFTIIRGEQ